MNHWRSLEVGENGSAAGLVLLDLIKNMVTSDEKFFFRNLNTKQLIVERTTALVNDLVEGLLKKTLNPKQQDWKYFIFYV